MVDLGGGEEVLYISEHVYVCLVHKFGCVACMGCESMTLIFYHWIQFTHKLLFALMVGYNLASLRCISYFEFKTWSLGDISVTFRDTPSTFSFPFSASQANLPSAPDPIPVPYC